MAQPDNNTQLSSAFKTFFERETLTGVNFNDWYRSLRIFLRVADTYDYLYKPCPNQPLETASEEDKAAWKAEYKKHNDVACLMLGKISPALQKQFESYPPQLMLAEIKKMFEKPQAVEIYDLVDALHSCKQAPGKSMSAHVLEMKGFERQGPYTLSTYHKKGRENKPKPQANKKDKSKGKTDKNKKVVPYQPKPKHNPLKRKENPNKDQTCHQCHIAGHWKRNCPLYLEELRKNKDKAEQVFTFRDLKRKGNRLMVNNICKWAMEHKQQLKPYDVVSMNGVFEIDMNNNVSKNNNNSIFSINKKRKLDLDSSYLWHCRLAHIGKTSMQKLQHEELLESINDESFDKCESCISGKITKKPFNNIERATDLLGLIHTDVCGPLRHVSRKALRSDRGGEYLSQEFKDYLRKNGIVQHLSSPYTPHQNGVSERRNRTLLDMVRSMFNLTTLPLSFWDYTLESVVRILNMVPTKKVDKTPYEIWHGKAPNLSYLKRLLLLFSTENKVIVARYGNFLERDLISQKLSGRDNNLEDDHMDTLPSENTSEIPIESESLGSLPELIPVYRSERTTRAPNRLYLNIEVEDDEVGDLGEPANYKAAMLDPDKVVRSKWLYKKKTDMDGKVHTYKARLVAKGCTQTYGIDYQETFSPVADIRAIMILIAIAAYYDMRFGYVDPKYPNRVCKLQRSIYGLKQASCQWNKRFDEEIKKFKFIQNHDEPCVYRKASGSDVVFLILYVDDILIMGNNIPRLKEVKDYLGKCFDMKDLGEAAYILGIKIYIDRSRRLIELS
nr:hypothetical protein [Tanacetum cinerariifolium]